MALSLESMLADLRATFPTLRTRPLSEFGEQWAHAGGIWTGQDTACMPDGLPIFSNLAYGEDGYDGPVHTGFLAWLEARGWGHEQYDGGTFFLVPLSCFEGAVREDA